MRIDLKNIFLLTEIMNHPGFHPDQPRKSFFARLSDNLAWFWRDGIINGEYNRYGLDVKGINLSDFSTERLYIKQSREMKQQNKLDKYTIMIDDKFLFALYCEYFKLPHPVVYQYCHQGTALELHTFEANSYFREHSQLFFKECNSCGGCGVSAAHGVDELESLRCHYSDNCYIVEQQVHQHESLSAIYPKSVNTIRLVTIYDKKNFSKFSAILRCGNHTSGNVDNICHGGLGIGITENGTLKKYTHAYNDSTNALVRHPDSGLIFEGYKLPFYEEAVAMALHAHTYFPQLPSIGWDLAITPTGPIFLEANADWGLPIMQMCNGGLRHEWEKLVHAYHRN